MKKQIVCLILALGFLTINAQERGKIRVGIDLGLGLPTMGGGLHGALDIRYNIMDNLNAGVKFTGGVLIKDILVNESAGTASITTGVINSTLVTSDYYFSKGESIFSPYLGGGLGFYDIINIGISVSGTTTPNPPTDYTPFLPVSRFGGLIRGGFESGHFRMGLEYYLIPSTNVIDMVTLNPVGTSVNSYLAVNVGFYFGGGHWRKHPKSLITN